MSKFTAAETASVERSCTVRNSTKDLLGVTFDPYTKTQGSKQYRICEHDTMLAEITAWVAFAELPE